MKRGTCAMCKTEQDVEKGKLVKHMQVVGSMKTVASGSGYPKGGRRTEGPVEIACSGAGGTPLETLTKNRERTRSKRLATVLAVRDEASVILDVMLSKRRDLDEEFGKARRDELFRLALVGFRLQYPKARKISHGILWWTGNIAKNMRAHKLYCRFCGFLVARFAIGTWAKLTEDAKEETTNRHVMICALQYLAGIRTLAEPGTKHDGWDGQLWDDALARQCRACGVLPGVTCIALEGNLGPLYAQHIPEPHEARRYS